MQALNVLVVEDEALIAMLVEDALLLHGHSVVGVAEDEAEAMAIVARETIDIALCDVKLASGDNGTEIAAMLAARGIPCLYVSGNCPAGDPNPLVIGCVSKPFATAALGRAVDAAYRIAHGDFDASIPAQMRLFGPPPL